MTPMCIFQRFLFCLNKLSFDITMHIYKFKRKILLWTCDMLLCSLHFVYSSFNKSSYNVSYNQRKHVSMYYGLFLFRDPSDTKKSNKILKIVTWWMNESYEIVEMQKKKGYLVKYVGHYLFLLIFFTNDNTTTSMGDLGSKYLSLVILTWF